VILSGFSKLAGFYNPDKITVQTFAVQTAFLPFVGNAVFFAFLVLCRDAARHVSTGL
jgi:hypothetical protein